MEDAIHRSGPVERWRWVSRRSATGPDCHEPEGTTSKPSPVAVALRRTLDILKRFPEALDAVQLGLREFIEAPS